MERQPQRQSMPCCSRACSLLRRRVPAQVSGVRVLLPQSLSLAHVHMDCQGDCTDRLLAEAHDASILAPSHMPCGMEPPNSELLLIGAGSQHKWLRMLVGNHFAPFYREEGRIIQLQFLDCWLKGHHTTLISMGTRYRVLVRAASRCQCGKENARRLCYPPNRSLRTFV